MASTLRLNLRVLSLGGFTPLGGTEAASRGECGGLRGSPGAVFGTGGGGPRGDVLGLVGCGGGPSVRGDAGSAD